MKALMTALALTLSGICHAAPEIWVFGDSLSSGPTSWPAVITELDKDRSTPKRDTFAHVRIAAQSMLSYTTTEGAQSFIIPPWMQCKGGKRFPDVRVILWLGSNDAIFGTPDAQFNQHVQAALDTLIEKECPLYFVLPPVPELSNPAYNGYMNKRGIMIQAAIERGIDVNNGLIDPPYNWSMTVDGLHPTDYQSWALAIYFMRRLGL